MYGQPHIAPLPVVGVTAGPGYATLIEAVVDELRTTLDAKVTPSSMDINTDLDFRSGGTSNGAINLGRVQLAPRAALVDPADETSVLQVDAAGELYYNDAAGNQVQLTGNGGVLGAAGNITGLGYGTGGVTLDWVAGSETYMFYSGPGAFADVAVDDVLMDGGSGNFLRMTAPALSAGYTVTWPVSAPAGTSGMMSMSTAGTIAVSNTVPNGNSLTVTSTGRFKHGQIQRVIPSCDFTIGPTSTDIITNVTFGHWKSAGTNTFMAPVGLDVGKRIVSLVFSYFSSATSGTRTFTLYHVNTATDAQTPVATISFPSAAAAVRTLTLTAALLDPGPAAGHVITNTGDYRLECTMVVNDFIKSVLMTYDHP